jgi:hypothetical protein
MSVDPATQQIIGVRPGGRRPAVAELDAEPSRLFFEADGFVDRGQQQMGGMVARGMGGSEPRLQLEPCIKTSIPFKGGLRSNTRRRA